MDTIKKHLQIWSIINTVFVVVALCLATLSLFFIYQKYQNSYKHKQDLLSAEKTLKDNDLVLQKYYMLDGKISEMENYLVADDVTIEKINELNSNINIRNISIFDSINYTDVILDLNADEKSIEFFVKDLRNHFKRVLIMGFSMDLTTEVIGGTVQLRILK